MDDKQLLSRIDQILKLADDALASRYRSDYGEWVKTDLKHQFRAAGLSFLEKVVGKSHPYFTEFEKESQGDRPSNVMDSRAVVKALRGEVEAGWLRSLRGLLSAEIFSDFGEMSAHLLEEGYKDAAAVLIGCTLEEHLRQLCIREKIALQNSAGTGPKKADTMNADLCKAGTYNMLDQKNATAWLDLRNKAAHGQTDQFNKDQVSLMHQGILNFMSRVPV